MSDRTMKILVVSQYFWPENMRINDLVRDLRLKGHEVTVLSGTPNYPEGRVFETFRSRPQDYAFYEGVRVIRVPMVPRGQHAIQLVLNYLSFFASASVFGAWKLRKQPFDVIFVYAVSPIMAAIPAVLLGRLKKAPVLVWVLDLWPETLRAVGVVRNPKLLSIVGTMVSWIYNRADYLLLQSEGFFSNVRRYCTRPINENRLVYFPSWAEDDFSQVSAPSTLLKKIPGLFTVVFAGNLGEAQDLPAVLKAAESLRGRANIRWVIVGDGRMSHWLVAQVAERNLDNVVLLGRHPLEAMPGLFALADALLVSLKTNDVFEKTIPGKVQAYLASGRPLLGMINGEASRVISDAGAGFVCRSGDAQGLADITLRLSEADLETRASMGTAARNFYQRHYHKAVLMDRLEALFRSATRRGSDTKCP